MNTISRFFSVSNNDANDKSGMLARSWHGRSSSSQQSTSPETSRKKEIQKQQQQRQQQLNYQQHSGKIDNTRRVPSYLSRHSNAGGGIERDCRDEKSKKIGRTPYNPRLDLFVHGKQQQQALKDVALEYGTSHIRRPVKTVSNNDKAISKEKSVIVKSADINTDDNNNIHEEITMSSSSDFDADGNTTRRDLSDDKEICSTKSHQRRSLDNARFDEPWMSRFAVPAEILLSFDDGRDVNDIDGENDQSSNRDENNDSSKAVDIFLSGRHLKALTADERNQIFVESVTMPHVRTLVDLDDFLDLTDNVSTTDLSIQRADIPIEKPLNDTSTVSRRRRCITGTVNLDALTSNQTESDVVEGNTSRNRCVASNADKEPSTKIESVGTLHLSVLAIKDQLKEILGHHNQITIHKLPFVIETKSRKLPQEIPDTDATCDTIYTSSSSSTVSSYHSTEINPVDVKFEELIIRKNVLAMKKMIQQQELALQKIQQMQQQQLSEKCQHLDNSYDEFSKERVIL